MPSWYFAGPERRMGPGPQSVVVSNPYAGGPGDIVASALGWWGLRAYSTAQATGSQAALDLHNDSTGVFVSTINILSSGSLDVATAATVIAGGASKVGKLYDQTGNGLHLVQATLADMPTLSLSALGSLPMLFNPGSSASSGLAVTISSQSQPYTASVVAKRSGNFTSIGSIFLTASTSTQFRFNNAANQVLMYAGDATPTAVVSDSAVHAMQVIFDNGGGTSAVYVDGSSNAMTLGAGGNGAINGTLRFMGDGTNPMTGYCGEFGLWSGNSSAQNSAMNSNQHAYWGF